MEDNYSSLSGQLEKWPTKSEMAELLISCGISVNVGKYAIRLQKFDHFVFQEYDFNGSMPSIDADAETKEQMLKEASQVSKCLSKAKLKHRFEVYDGNDEIVGYYHYEWPNENSA